MSRGVVPLALTNRPRPGHDNVGGRVVSLARQGRCGGFGGTFLHGPDFMAPWQDNRGRFAPLKALVFAALFVPAAWLLYVRSHWRRMPPLQLTAHLLRKMVIRRARRSEPAEA